MSYDVSKMLTLGQLKSALNVIDAGLDAKLDLPVVVSATVGTTQGNSGTGVWVTDNTFSDLPYHYDIADENVLATDIATVTVSPANLGEAAACGLCHTNQTLAGVIRLYSKAVPTTNLSIEYTLNATYVISS